MVRYDHHPYIHQQSQEEDVGEEEHRTADNNDNDADDL